MFWLGVVQLRTLLQKMNCCLILFATKHKAFAILSWLYHFRIAVWIRQTIRFIEISIEAGILLGGKHKACFVLGFARIAVWIKQ